MEREVSWPKISSGRSAAMKREFALVQGGVKRLKITYAWNLKNAEVFFDRKRVGTFATKADFERGSTFTLPDGSSLLVRFGSVTGAPFLKGVHLLRNGVPVPGSAADPVPKWAWPFMIGCAAIPVVSLGGALPAALAAAGVGGMLSAARTSRWSTAVRVGACALIMVACWGAFGLVVTTVRGDQSTLFMSSSPDKLMQEIEATYTKQGFRPDTITAMMANFRQVCDKMDNKHCTDYLRSSLQQIKAARY
jgi:hypothetical protein